MSALLSDQARLSASSPMQPEDFRQLVAGEQPLEIARPQLVPIALAHTPGTLSQQVLQLQSTGKLTRTVYRHILGPPASADPLLAWQSRWPKHTLPDDLVELLSHFDGVHLWADDSGRSYEGLAPLEEWQPALFAMYGVDASPALLPEAYIALSYHADGAAYVVLDPVTGEYFLMDTAGPDRSCRIAESAAELLDWLWANRIRPSSRRTS